MKVQPRAGDSQLDTLKSVVGTALEEIRQFGELILQYLKEPDVSQRMFLLQSMKVIHDSLFVAPLSPV